MRTEGKLTKWNDDRGFGFITPTQSGPEIFVHISAFPKDGYRPKIGERVTFEIEVDREGKKRATHVFCPDQPAARPQPRRELLRRNEKPSIFTLILPFIILAGVGFYAYQYFTTPKNFSCDGRTHCSQMTSCAEAKFFLRNCPDTKMDGNHDGTPCEQQWCTSPFAK